MAEWLKKNEEPSICCLLWNWLQIEKHIQTEGMEKDIFHANVNETKPGVVILDRIDFKTKTLKQRL